MAASRGDVFRSATTVIESGSQALAKTQLLNAANQHIGKTIRLTIGDVRTRPMGQAQSEATSLKVSESADRQGNRSAAAGSRTAVRILPRDGPPSSGNQTDLIGIVEP